MTTKQISFGIITVLFTIICLELILIFLSLFLPAVNSALSSPWTTFIPDKHVVHRFNPGSRDIDKKGFRNPNVPRTAEIITLGDSQTYGLGVLPSDAWPRRLESMSGRRVYGMAVGGFSPAHSLNLWDEASDFQPKIVIEALYSGNDLYDAYSLVYNYGQLPELKNNDLTLQEKIKTLNKAETISEQTDKTFTDDFLISSKKSKEVSISPLRSLLGHSKIYGLFRRINYELGHISERRALSKKIPESEKWMKEKVHTKKTRKNYEIFDNGQFKTIFESEYRSIALNLQDPRIQEGHQIVVKAIEKMSQLGKDRGIRFFVVLIPTKELVFQDLVKDPSESYRTLIAQEEKFWNETTDFFEKHNIEYVDALPALKKELVNGNNPYKEEIDGHTNKFGHKAIAEVVNSQIQK